MRLRDHNGKKVFNGARAETVSLDERRRRWRVKLANGLYEHIRLENIITGWADRRDLVDFEWDSPEKDNSEGKLTSLQLREDSGKSVALHHDNADHDLSGSHTRS